MKTLSAVVACSLLVSLPSAAFNTPPILSQTREIAQTQDPRINDSLQVAISERVRVSLKKGSPQSGNLLKFTSQNLVLAAGDRQKPLAIADIRSVEFQGNVWIPDNSGGRVIRGQDRTTRQQKTWASIPLDALDVQQNAKTAFLRLGNVLKPEDLRDLRSLSQDVIYVLDKIEFEPSGKKMTVKATPIDRRSFQ